MYVTYFMVKWEEETLSPSGQRCAECGREMDKLEAVVGDSDASYEGLVCHSCKRVLWVRKS